MSNRTTADNYLASMRISELREWIGQFGDAVTAIEFLLDHGWGDIEKLAGMDEDTRTVLERIAGLSIVSFGPRNIQATISNDLIYAARRALEKRASEPTSQNDDNKDVRVEALIQEMQDESLSPAWFTNRVRALYGFSNVTGEKLKSAGTNVSSEVRGICWWKFSGTKEELDEVKTFSCELLEWVIEQQGLEPHKCHGATFLASIVIEVVRNEMQKSKSAGDVEQQDFSGDACPTCGLPLVRASVELVEDREYVCGAQFPNAHRWTQSQLLHYATQISNLAGESEIPSSVHTDREIQSVEGTHSTAPRTDEQDVRVEEPQPLKFRSPEFDYTDREETPVRDWIRRHFKF